MRTLCRLALALALAGAAHAQAPPEGQSNLLGDWSGVGYQVNGAGPQDDWTILLEIRAGLTSHIEYPSLGCTGDLLQLSASSEEIEFREQITEGDCITRGRIIVRYRDNRVLWFWHAPKSTDSASAVLFRAAPGS